MISRKKIFLIFITVILLCPFPAFSAKKKANKKDEDAALKRQQELMEKRAKAEADIAARIAEEERLEQERLEAERLEAERLEQERLEAERLAEEQAKEEELLRQKEEEERLEAERLEAERLEAERLEKEKQELAALQQQMEIELEKQKNMTEKNRREYLSDYMVYDVESIDDIQTEDDSDYYIQNPDERDASGKTLLMRAAKAGNEWEINLLLKSGAKVNLTDDDGWTALMYAVRYSEGTGCTEALLEAGAEVTEKNRYGSSALVLASCYNGNPQILKMLLEKYGSSDKEVMRSLVFLLSEQNISEYQQLTKLQLYMDKAAPLNVLYEGKTPLMYAAQYGNSTKIIQKLLDNQASVTLRSTEGKTAFDYAMNNKNLAHDEAFWALNNR